MGVGLGAVSTFSLPSHERQWNGLYQMQVVPYMSRSRAKDGAFNCCRW